jgi:hypothetical protein
MVIPAGTNPEAMMTKQSGTQDFKKKTSSFKKTSGTAYVGNGHFAMDFIEWGTYNGQTEADIPE